GEEGLAQPVAHFLRNSRSVVADREAQPARPVAGPAARGTNTDDDASPRRRGFNRVDDQVGEDLPHLAGKYGDVIVGFVLADDSKVLFANPSHMQLQYLFNQVGEMHLNRCTGLPGEG